MSQCVPRWELDVEPPPPPPPPHLPNSPPPTTPQQLPLRRPAPHVPPTAGMSEPYEVAELTWENGHLSLQGHGVPRVAKPLPKFPSAAAPWSKHHHHGGGGGHGTLEAVVDQATRPQLVDVGPGFNLLAWLGGTHPSSSAADVLVPCGVVAAAGGLKRGRGGAAVSQGSSERGESTLATFDTSSGDGDGDGGAEGDGVCFTPATTTTTNNHSASLGSPETENTSVGRGGGCYDSVCHSRRSQRDGVLCNEEEKLAKREVRRSSSSAKKSRAAAVHNKSERKRRDRINQRMNTLQKLVPNSSKADKASMLDEVIEYVKQLQAQVQMMNWISGMTIPMPPPPPPPPLQMSMMANMAQMAQMGMGMGMSLPSLPPLLHPSAFLPITSPLWDGSGDRFQLPSGPVMLPDPFSAFLACQAAQAQYSAVARILHKL